MTVALHLTDELTTAVDAIVQRVQQSLVVIQSGGHGVGAGIIWGPQGLIMTNAHVVGRGSLRVTLEDGREHSARLLAKDPEVDLALLQIDCRDLPAATIAGERSLRVGQLVLAVGHPWGQRGNVTVGVISAVGRAETRGTRREIDIIHSDVGLAPGNSGGPLVDATGAVIGINCMIVGGDRGIAIPSQVASDFASRVLAQAQSGDAPYQAARPGNGNGRRDRAGWQAGEPG